jgi:pyridoxamine 5'-phosphate oxidase
LENHIPAWRRVLRAAQAKEKNSISKNWIQLATTATDGSPRVRTVVFRGWHGASELDLLTDRRSEKSIEIQENPRIEICWLLPKAKSQFRFRGINTFLTAEREKEAVHQH